MPPSITVGDLLKRLAENSEAATLLYQSYLLRVWRESASGPWRATLEQVSTGKTYSFARLESLVTFLNDPSHPPSDAEPDTMTGTAGSAETPTGLTDSDSPSAS
jgi:hypothetical protein